MSDINLNTNITNVAQKPFVASTTAKDVSGSADDKTITTNNDEKVVSQNTKVSSVGTDNVDDQVKMPKVSETLEKSKKEKELSRYLQERNQEIAQERMNDLNRQNIGLNFSIDKQSDNTIVKVTDLNTKKLVRQIPSEEFLEMSERLKKYTEQNASDEVSSRDTKGILFDEQA
ncbi:MAG: flagellar protein FlaG [Succinatimonas sp.]|nr:flagellar protein FlaG [Succinatimonas sp.]MDD5869150.1 flagellar protein FlaG [Succinatimonas sp.]MDY5721992.1 flagellar protein FlaG [Succinivibrio sp.]